MAGVVKGMDATLKSMNLEKVVCLSLLLVKYIDLIVVTRMTVYMLYSSPTEREIC